MIYVLILDSVLVDMNSITREGRANNNAFNEKDFKATNNITKQTMLKIDATSIKVEPTFALQRQKKLPIRARANVAIIMIGKQQNNVPNNPSVNAETKTKTTQNKYDVHAPIMLNIKPNINDGIDLFILPPD